MKPSELPVNTFIEFDGVDGGLFQKHEDNVWRQVNAHCVDCVIFVADDLSKLADSWDVVRFPSDEYFKEFKIIAYPAVVVDCLAVDLAEIQHRQFEDGTTPDSVIEQVIKDLGA